MRRAALIFNPVSGRRVHLRRVPKLLRLLERYGFETEALPTGAPGDATRLARTHAETGIDVAFALGGDGTVREVAAGLLGTDVALGILPAGTANVLSYEFGIPRLPTRAVRALAEGSRQKIDVGMANDLPFLMMVSGGFDARVMARQNAERKRRFGPAAIAFSGAWRWWSWESPLIEIKVDGRSELVPFFCVCNIPFYGGPFLMVPDADPQDGQLDLLTFERPGRLALLSFGLDVLLRRHVRRGDVQHRRFRELEIVGPLPWGLQTDGDSLPVSLPRRITVLPRALDVLVPQRSGRKRS